MIEKLFYLLIILQLSFAGYSYAQQTKAPKNVLASDGKYIAHKISKGETIFSICKKYNIEEKELMVANPALANGLKTGETLNIPKKITSKKKKEKNEDEFISHTVKLGETLYSLSKQYTIPIETIVKFNPEAKNGVKVDQIVRIPGFAGEANANDHNKVKSEAPAKNDFTEYEVEEGETFFGLLRKFGITKSELLAVNPGMPLEIKVGQIVKLPKAKDSSASNSSKGKYIEHNVEAGETVYGLAAEYDVKVFEIMELNPDLKERGLVTGVTILIPRTDGKKPENTFKTEVKSEEKEMANGAATKAKQTVVNLRDTFHISMFLPLFLNENFSNNNDSEDLSADSTNNNLSSTRKDRSLYSNSRNYLSFYEGFLIALDTMKKTGINISVDLYDNQFKQTVVDSVMRKPKLLDANLIVGPVDVKLQKNISAFSYKNQIPLVSPFSSDDDYVNTNPFYFQVNPTKDFIYRKTADFIGREFWGKNVIVMTPYSFEQISGGDIVELVREKLRSNSSKNNGGAISFSKVTIAEGYWEVKDNLKKDQENVIFILPPTNKVEREAILSKAINSLYVLSEEYNITLVGMSEYAGYKSINAEYFHKLKMHYLTPNFIDYYNPEVNSFIKNYRKKFKTEPNQFSYRGYDIAKYFLEAYRTNGKNYLNKLSSSKINTLQSNFKMKRIKEFSGFMNNSLFVVNFTPEYDVKVVSIISE